MHTISWRLITLKYSNILIHIYCIYYSFPKQRPPSVTLQSFIPFIAFNAYKHTYFFLTLVIEENCAVWGKTWSRGKQMILRWLSKSLLIMSRWYKYEAKTSVHLKSLSVRKMPSANTYTNDCCEEEQKRQGYIDMTIVNGSRNNQIHNITARHNNPTTAVPY